MQLTRPPPARRNRTNFPGRWTSIKRVSVIFHDARRGKTYMQLKIRVNRVNTGI